MKRNKNNFLLIKKMADLIEQQQKLSKFKTIGRCRYWQTELTTLFIRRYVKHACHIIFNLDLHSKITPFY